MRTTINLDKELYELSKLSARKLGIRVSALIEQALRMMLVHNQGSPRKKSPKFKLITCSGKLQDDTTDLDKPSNLIIREDEDIFG